MLLQAEDSQLVLVDYQQRLMPAIHDGPAVVANAMRLANAARLLEVPSWGTEQNPQGLGPLDPSLRPLIDQVVSKMTVAAAEQLAPRLRPPARAPQGNARSLPKHLQKAAPAQEESASIVIAGCEAHVCLLQTALELLEQEFEVWVVTDACGSRTERNRDAAFDRLAGAGCELVTTEMVIFEWLGSAEHPRFKEALALVK
jgi:nicotinamidase-related amidase